MSEMADFDKISKYFVVEGVLVNETPLRVGSGKDRGFASSVDNPVIRMRVQSGGESLELPYIPGSSIKGALRALLGSFLRSKGQGNVEEVLEGIFGSTELASHVVVDDAYPIGIPSISVRTGIKIDNKFGSVERGYLYTMEYVEPGARWKFRMEIFNIDLSSPDDERARALRFLLDALFEGLVRIGGRKSVGLGRIRLIKEETKIYEVEFAPEGFQKREIPLTLGSGGG